MISKKLNNTFNEIAREAYEMVSQNVVINDLTGRINYAAIFAHSDEEFNKITKELKSNGEISDEQPTGNYYLLNFPIETKYGLIKNCRVVKPNPGHIETGYLDFEAVDYGNFKKIYLSKPGFSKIISIKGVELVELRSPKFNVRAYFPESF